VLLADSSTFSMGMVQSILDMAGYAVVEAANLDEAIRAWNNARWILSLRPKTAVQWQFRAALCHETPFRLEEIPVLAIAESSNDMSTSTVTAPGSGLH